MMAEPREFDCQHYRFDAATGTLSLLYAFDTGVRFEERMVFPVADRQLSAPESAALDRVFRMLLLACGVSYYKAFAPPRITVSAFPLEPATATFFTEFYTKGLAEFAYRNGIDLASRLHIAADAVEAPSAIGITLPRRTCVPVGGGKDSIVTVECLKRAEEPLVLFSLGTAAPIDATIRQSGLPSIRVTRRLDPTLFDLNAAGALNGHVPITGILSMIVLACAIICGFDTIAMSNEHSASAPNITADGVDVNHQWSKSFAFEQALQRHLVRHVVDGINYFSFLRPLTEVAIARRFAHQPAYLPIFRSCNTAFRQAVETRPTNWCCDCPKCRFVYLALAPFVAKPQLIATFGRDLLDDPAQTDGFAELGGLRRFKPFECVGEIEESAALMQHLAGLPDWRDAAVVRALAPRVTAGDLATLFAPRAPHAVPDRFMAMLDARA
jgi:UDP-N-acetyl-alpha-D-muramoyl-L-alanyl-L-glutamate epimerase